MSAGVTLDENGAVVVRASDVPDEVRDQLLDLQEGLDRLREKDHPDVRPLDPSHPFFAHEPGEPTGEPRSATDLDEVLYE